MKKIKFIIRQNVFKTDLVFIGNCTVQELNKDLKKMGLDPVEDEEIMAGRLIKNQYGCYRILYLREMNKSISSLGELVHEIFHLVIRLCEDRGIPVIPNVQTGHCGDETAAYLMEYLYNEVVKRI